MIDREEDERDYDVEIEITNGKKVTFNLDYTEWVIIMCGASLLAWITGLTI